METAILKRFCWDRRVVGALEVLKDVADSIALTSGGATAATAAITRQMDWFAYLTIAGVVLRVGLASVLKRTTATNPLPVESKA